MNEEQTALLIGRIDTNLSRENLLSSLKEAGLNAAMCESSQYEEGFCIQVEVHSFIVLERIDDGVEYLIHGDGATPDEVSRDAERLSSALARLAIKHKMEIYDHQDTQVGYCQWGWPEE